MAIVEVSEVSRLLAERIDALVQQWLPHAVKEGHEWRCGSVAGEPGRSMAIHASGPRVGVWADFSDDSKRGDALDLVAWVGFNGDKKRAFAWAKSWLGLDSLDPARLKQERARVKAESKRAEAAALEDAARRARRAKAMWLDASGALLNTPVDHYLRGRGIALDSLPRLPRALRFARAMAYPDGTMWPGMMGAICNFEGQHIATHRTFLAQGPNGWGKAPVKDAKLTIGSYRGGFISLARGASGKPLSESPDGDRVIICEGIEDGLTLACAMPEYRVLAAISVGNFQNVMLPRSVHEVVIAADNDKPDSPAARALQGAVDSFMDRGHCVRVCRPPDEYKDFNDWWRAMQHAAPKKEFAQ